jgi:hypothetical protein
MKRSHSCAWRNAEPRGFKVNLHIKTREDRAASAQAVAYTKETMTINSNSTTHQTQIEKQRPVKMMFLMPASIANLTLGTISSRARVHR